jgi:hypothetical protein
MMEVRARLRRLFPSVLFLLFVLAVYANPSLVRRNFAGRDLAVYNLPMEKAMHDAYARGRLPVWMPEISGGRPLLPNPNAGAMYPLRAVLSLVSFPTAMRLAPVIHWIAAGIGVIVLLRTLGVSAAGAWIGAITYVFSGVGVSEVYFPNLHPGMALLPWIVWTIGRPASRPAGKILLLSFLYGLDFLAGDVFTIGMAIAASLLWIVVEKPRRERGAEILRLAGALALGGLLALPQILATTLWIPDTDRAVLGMKLFETLFFSIHPLRLLELVVPFPYGAVWKLDDTAVWGWPIYRYKGMGMFLTLYSGAFAVVALATTRRIRTPGLRFGRWLFALSLAVAVPPSLLPRSWEGISSPLPLRNPEKFSVALVFALAVIAGIAFDRLREKPRRLRWPLAVGAMLSVLALASWLAPSAAGRLAVEIAGDARWLAIASHELPGALAEGAFLWMLTFVALDRMSRPRGFSLFAAVALMTLVPLAANRKIAQTVAELELFSPPRFVRLLQRIDPEGAYRTLGESLYAPPSKIEAVQRWGGGALTETKRRSWVHHAHALWSRGTVFNRDFDVGDFTRLGSLRRLSVAAVAYTDSARFFESFSLRWGIRFRDQRPVSGYAPFGGDELQSWDVLEGAQPDIRVASRWVEESNSMRALSALPALARGEIVVETGRRGRGESPGGTVRALVREPERLVLETSVRRPSWLFVLRGYWTSRSVELDGRRVESVPAQIAFSALPVPPGRHRIVWREQVPGFEVSVWGPVAYAIFGLALGAAALRGGGARRASEGRS